MSPDTPATFQHPQGALLGSLDQKEVGGLENLILEIGSLKKCLVHKVKATEQSILMLEPNHLTQHNPLIPCFFCASVSLLEDKGEDSVFSHWTLKPA